MTLKRLSRLRSSLRSSLWAVPLVAIPLELVSTRVLHGIDGWLGWTILGFGTAGAQATLQAIVTATLSFVVFTFGSLLVAIQVASAQLTSRIIATTLLQDDVVKYTVGLFIFTLLFSLSAQSRIDSEVNELVLFVTMFLGIACFAGFFYLIDHASRLLRPISILVLVCNRGLAVIRNVYPDLCRGPDRSDESYRAPGPPSRFVLHRGSSAIVLAIDFSALLAKAQRSDVDIEFVPQVGDFVAADEPLFNIYGACEATDDALRASVTFGSERTLEQDPTFSFRIIIDIALRALSPAINDPTTAVLAIDQLHRLLRAVGMRHLRSENVFDASGRARVIVRTPNWEDFVNLAFSEIRKCGSNNLQIVRRLRAMILNLIHTLPVHRHRVLDEQLSLLDREIERSFSYPEEQMLARVADTQGLGGSAAR